MKRTAKKTKEKKIAKERIELLFEKAENIFNKNQGLANRYVTLARKIGMKMNIRLAPIFKRKFCKHCYKFLRSGVNARIRTREGKLVIYCLNCKKYTRIPLKK